MFLFLSCVSSVNGGTELLTEPPDERVTRAACGPPAAYGSPAVVVSSQAVFARAVADKLGYAPPRAGKSPVRWWFALSVGRTGLDDRGDGDFEWIMRPELVTALRTMKWA